MQHVTSADGTRIAIHRTGGGQPVVIVGGAFSTAAAGAPLAAALAEVGFEGVTVDRRGRGESGDAGAFSPEREVEDLAAVVAATGPGTALLGHSSGAVLVLLAAAGGVPAEHLFLSEPPFRFGVDEPPADLSARLQALIDGGDPEGAVTLFQREGVGLSEQVVAGIRQAPFFPSLVAIAQTVVYDATITHAVSTPTAAMLAVSTPTTILRGEPTFPMLVAAAERLADAMPSAELVVVPESHEHAVDPAGTAREVAARLH